MQKHLNEIENKYSATMNSEAIFDLFVSDNDLKMLKTKLIHKTIHALSNNVIEFHFFIQKNNVDLGYLQSQIDNGNMHEKHKELLEEYNIKMDGRAKAASLFHKSIINIYREVSDTQSEFQGNCRKYLYKLLQKEQE